MSYFTVWNAEPRIPVVAHIPHASPVIPPDVRDQFVVDDDELRRQVSLLTDWHTDELYAPAHITGGFAIRADVSPVVVDAERFVDDAEETMAEHGLGVVYSNGVDGRPIRRPLSEDERDALLTRFYGPYHSQLIQATERCLRLFGRCTIIDCHAARSTPLPFESRQHVRRPDVSIGTDWHHTPQALVRDIERLVKRRGWSFGVDEPHPGTYIPLPFYGDGRISSFMVEVKCSLYMDEQTNVRHEGFSAVTDLIADIVHLACES